MLKRSVELYGHSIIFQNNDPIVKDPKSNHWIVAMVEKDFLNYQVTHWINTCDAVYDETVTYKPTKCAIYMDRI